MSLTVFISKRFSSGGQGRFLKFARAVSFISVMLGVLALLLSLAILYGFENDLKKAAVKFTSHIVINTLNREPIQQADEVISLLKSKYSEVASAVPICEREGLVRSDLHTDGVLIKSYSPDSDINEFYKNIKIGEKRFSSDSANEVILGQRLASKLGVECGSSVILYAIKSSASGLPDSRIAKFKVIGLYQTGMAQYDENLVLIPLGTSRNFLKIASGDCNKIEVMLKDINQSSVLSKKMMDFLGFPFWTMTYYEIHSSIFAWIELQKEPIPLVLGIISLVAVLNIITTLLIMVVEKTHTIGVLRTLGMKRLDIVKIFVSQGIRIGSYGMIFGAIVAFALSLLQQQFHFMSLKGEIYYLDSLPIFISPLHYAVVLSISFILILLSTVIPALVASGLKPMKTIRFK